MNVSMNHQAAPFRHVAPGNHATLPP
ncbi:Protein CBG25843 [Caenorhabditis briggsae]|uniref:Protein CBG25843 n=1 Tax=Caenorhabditis briggsae TaxID=6238 RepID=B6IHB4_CAEBR|nr:Protein CBG25843 [Caenorhabditis briggsae]CAR99294.1 Protein CBG25843 [Caenorhabditis briggsae]